MDNCLEDKKILKHKIEKEYTLSHQYANENLRVKMRSQIKSIVKRRYTGWSRLSKEINWYRTKIAMMGRQL